MASFRISVLKITYIVSPGQAFFFFSYAWKSLSECITAARFDLQQLATFASWLGNWSILCLSQNPMNSLSLLQVCTRLVCQSPFFRNTPNNLWNFLFLEETIKILGWISKLLVKLSHAFKKNVSSTKKGQRRPLM